jgi:peroxiredoxin family protein
MVFFTFWGLNLLRGDRPNLNAPKEKASFMQTMFKWMMPKGPKRQGLGQLNFGGMGASIMGGIMRNKNIQDLPALIKGAREQNVRFVACTMSMAVMGISQRELEPYDNLEFGGVATFVEAGRNAPLTLVF